MLAFIIAAAAGYISRMVRDPIETLIEKILLDKIDISKEDSMALSYALCMLAAAFVISVAGSKIPVFGVLLGGLLGLFAVEIYKAIMAQINGSKKSAEAVEEKADE